MPDFPFSRTVTFLRKTLGAKDLHGNPSVTTTPILVPGCAVWPRVSSENVNGQDLVITGVTVFAPDGTTVLPTDQAVIDGLTYEVVGDPGLYASPLTGTRAGVEVQLMRVTG